MKLLRALIIAALLAAAGAAGYWYFFARPTAVAIVSPTRGDAAEIVYASGVVEPRNWAKVTPLLRERIVWVCDCEGESVESGHELARLDDSEAQAVRAELNARHKLAVAERDRIALLVDRNVMNQTELDRSHSNVNQLEALLAGQEARLANFVLRAPSDGIVLRQDAEVGEVADLGHVLFWVGRPSPLIVIAEVNEEDITRVEAGQRTLLRSGAFPGRELEAEVASITPKGDPVTKTYRVRLALPDDTPLMIGMSVDANVIARVSRETMLIDAQAVRGDAVFVVEGEEARRRAVETGIRGTERVEILSGLAEDDRVVSPYPEDMADGARIRIEGR